nr:reverse transcriptase domain-containing protein [Tanacetum cinerariifolium]
DEETTFQKQEQDKKNSKWKLYTDGASSGGGYGAGLMVVSPNGIEFIKTGKKSLYEKQVAEATLKEEDIWMTPIVEYLGSSILPINKKFLRKIRVKAPNYRIIEGILYK